MDASDLRVVVIESGGEMPDNAPPNLAGAGASVILDTPYPRIQRLILHYKRASATLSTRITAQRDIVRRWRAHYVEEPLPEPSCRLSCLRLRTLRTLAASPFHVVPIEDVEIESVLEALSVVFGPRSLEWYRWKHIENPSGPSLGWVAIDASGIIGVRLFQRWDLIAGDLVLPALRPVDTMTLPRARRRGVFKTLLHTALDNLSADEQNALIFSTPNQNSRSGYAKNGWTLLPVIRHGQRFTTPGSRFGTSSKVDSLERSNQAIPGSIATLKSIPYLTWRYDARAGHAYSAATVDDGFGQASIVYRVVTRRRIRRLVLCEAFGPNSLVRRLVAATARSEGAAVTILATGTGTGNLLKPHLLHGSSTLAVRPLLSVDPDPLLLGSWNLSLGDLEDVL